MARVFISHSSEDREVAGQLVDLLRLALNLGAKEVSCTSVDGFGLRGGEHVFEALKELIRSCDSFVVLVSEASMGSLSVFWEMGIAEGGDKPIVPLLAPGAEPEQLEGPFRGQHLLASSNAGDIHQFLRQVGEPFGSVPADPVVYKRRTDDLLRGVSSPSNPPPVNTREYRAIHNSIWAYYLLAYKKAYYGWHGPAGRHRGSAKDFSLEDPRDKLEGDIDGLRSHIAGDRHDELVEAFRQWSGSVVELLRFRGPVGDPEWERIQEKLLSEFRPRLRRYLHDLADALDLLPAERERARRVAEATEAFLTIHESMWGYYMLARDQARHGLHGPAEALSEASEAFRSDHAWRTINQLRADIDALRLFLSAEEHERLIDQFEQWSLDLHELESDEPPGDEEWKAHAAQVEKCRPALSDFLSNLAAALGVKPGDSRASA